jgi:hypothetical protein
MNSEEIAFWIRWLRCAKPRKGGFHMRPMRKDRYIVVLNAIHANQVKPCEKFDLPIYYGSKQIISNLIPQCDFSLTKIDIPTIALNSSRLRSLLDLDYFRWPAAINKVTFHSTVVYHRSVSLLALEQQPN